MKEGNLIWGNGTNYDAMGNIVNDKNKGVTEIQYNHANLPLQIVRNNTIKPEDNGRMKYYYSAAGQKLMTEVSTDPSQGGSIVAEKTRVYLSAMVLKGGAIEFLGTAEGRALTIESLHKNPDGQVSFPNYIDASSNRFRYEYHLKDHLGNLRVACRCGDPKRKNNGDVAPNNNNREPIRIVQQNDYDAWGLDFGNPTSSLSGVEDRFQYNSKERIQDLGIEMYDYGARHYDATVGKFTSKDRYSEKFVAQSTYLYASNSPIRFIDVNGDSTGINIPYTDLEVNMTLALTKGSASVQGKVLGLPVGFTVSDNDGEQDIIGIRNNRFSSTIDFNTESGADINRNFGTLNLGIVGVGREQVRRGSTVISDEKYFSLLIGKLETKGSTSGQNPEMSILGFKAGFGIGVEFDFVINRRNDNTPQPSNDGYLDNFEPINREEKNKTSTEYLPVQSLNSDEVSKLKEFLNL